jgi:hypothetical protein
MGYDQKLSKGLTSRDAALDGIPATDPSMRSAMKWEISVQNTECVGEDRVAKDTGRGEGRGNEGSNEYSGSGNKDAKKKINAYQKGNRKPAGTGHYRWMSDICHTLQHSSCPLALRGEGLPCAACSIAKGLSVRRWKCWTSAGDQ